jgi:hypothetical protein
MLDPFLHFTTKQVLGGMLSRLLSFIVFIVKARRVANLPGLICIASQVIFYVKRNRWRRLANAGYHQA